MFDRIKGKRIVTLLLVLSCIISGIILGASPDYKVYELKDTRQLDSLITLQLQQARILDDHYRMIRIPVDTVFTRKEYRIRVPSHFSKTLFHLDLVKDLKKYDLDLPARVELPSRDMDIYLYYEGTILRTLRLTTDSALDSLMIYQN